ncbi:MAG: glycosyltransferase family 2 protein [Bergeyella cardium]
MLSVIIPLYNAQSSIIRALNSIKAQNFDNSLEIIIINDGSTDNSQLLVEHFIHSHPELDIHLINQENKGVSSARNAGLKHSKGSYIALLDADDEWLPHKTETQLNYLLHHQEIDFLATRFNDKKLLFPYATRKNLCKVTFRKLLFRNEIQPSTVIFKREILNSIGYFCENQNYAEDVNYWLKISEKHHLFILNQSLVIAGQGKRTFGVSGLSANLPEMAKGYRKNLKEMYLMKRISFIELIIYRIFYRLKYIFLRFRTFYHKFGR